MSTWLWYATFPRGFDCLFFSAQLLGSLHILLALPSPVGHPYLLATHKQIASAVAELIQTQAGSVKTQREWMMLLFVLECVGIGSNQSSSSLPMPAIWPPQSTTTNSIESNSQSDEPTPLAATMKTSSALLLESLCKFDVLVEESINPHDPDIFFKCCKTLSDLVRSDVHVSAANFSVCVHCIRTFSEVSGCALAMEHEASAGRFVLLFWCLSYIGEKWGCVCL